MGGTASIDMKYVKRYCLIVFSWTALGLVLLGAFNYTIDPRKFFDAAKLTGIDFKRTEIFYHLGVAKAYQFYRSDASGLILGSSRAAMAIDPSHPSLATQNYYNFATPGAVPDQDYHKLKAAIATRKIERIIYCVDFFAFNSFSIGQSSFREEFNSRLARNNSLWKSPVFLRQALLDYGAHLWAYRTLRDSIATIRKQEDADTGSIQYTILEDDGRWDLVSPTNRRVLRAFENTENSYLGSSWFPSSSRRFSLNETADSKNRSFTDFAALLSLAQASNIETTIVMLPVHARLLETLSYAGLWDNFEYWKRQLVAINEEVARSYGTLPFTVWDFNGYFPLTSEPVRDGMDVAPLQGFLDSSHASVATGNKILDIIAGDPDPEFGARINGKNIDNWLSDQRKRREAFRASDPELAANLENNVNRLRAKSPWEVSPVPESKLIVNKVADPEHSD